MKSAQSQLERHQDNLFIVNFDQVLFTKGILEFVVKILDKYTYKEFLKIPF